MSAPSNWIPAEKELPGNARCVLATDLEAHFVAVFWNEVWTEAHTSDEIDSVVTHWNIIAEIEA